MKQRIKSLRHHRVKGPPVESQTPSLLERLSPQEEIKTPRLPLLERLSSELSPWLNHLGRRKPRNRKQSLKLVKSWPQSPEETSKSRETHSTDIHVLSTESKPSLLDRLNMECNSSTPYSESERREMRKEVDDMKYLTGIMPESNPSSMSIISLQEPQRKRSFEAEIAFQGKGQMMTDSETWTEMTSGDKDDLTKNRGFSSLKCHGSVLNNELGDRTRTLAATKQGTSLIS